MSDTFDCTTEEGRTAGVEAAAAAVRDHQVVVLPTDTVYGVGADAFSPDAVASVLAAKGRGREMPPPVLIPHARTVDGLATAVPGYARDLMDAFWPGGLTLILLAQTSLMWDLGDTNGTVAVRVPQDPTALALLEQVGPMAVTSANLTGRPAALTVREAQLMLGDAVSVYLDGGPCTDDVPSTILDCTQSEPRILRHGAISQERILEVLGGVRLGPTSAPVPGSAEGPREDLALAEDVDEEVAQDADVPTDAARDGEPDAAPYVPRHGGDTIDGIPVVEHDAMVERRAQRAAAPADAPHADAPHADAPVPASGAASAGGDVVIAEDPTRDAPGLRIDPNL